MEVIKIAVERIVQPVPAREHLKDIFREELWGHVSALCAEEVSRGLDDGTALEMALHRLGDPERLRADYLDALSPSERWEGRLLRLLRSDGSGGVFRQTFRQAIVIVLSLYAPFLLFLFATYPLPGMNSSSYILSALSCALVLVAIAAQVISWLHAASSLQRTFVHGLASGGVTCLAWLLGYALLLPALWMQERTELLPVYYLFGLQVLAPLWALLMLARFAAAAWSTWQHPPLKHWPYALAHE